MNPHPNPEAGESEYYPRRARWYSPVFTLGAAAQRRLHLDRIHLPGEMTWVQFVLGLVIPGYSLLVGGRRTMGWTFFGLYLAAAVVFVVALGYQLGSVGYGLMISVHASSIIFMEGYWFREMFGVHALAGRFLLALFTLLVVWLAIYAPPVAYVQENWFTPLRVQRKVIVLRRLPQSEVVQRGDFVMYEMRAGNLGQAHGGGGMVAARAGFGWGPVLAVAGDRVEFSTNQFFVNGQGRPLRPYMPTEGDVWVAEKHWFIWPEVVISNGQNASAASITVMMLRLAMVDQNQFVGKPFKHWFGRRQTLL